MATQLPSVSIGIPFFNAERFLLDAIKSVFAQTHQDWELILMDDGSTDRSLEIAKSIQDPRVRVFSDGQNKKLAARLNEINSLARFDFIARMDADDLMATDRIQKQLQFLSENPDCALVTTGVASVTDEAVPYGVRAVADNHILTPYKVLSGAHGIVHAAVVGRRSWFARNPYDPADVRAQDYKLWVRALLRRDLAVGFISESLYFYREEGGASPQKMLAGQLLGREVVKKNGPQLIGIVATGYLLFRSHLKSTVTRVAALIGGIGFIVRSRNSHLSDDTFKLICDQIGKVRGYEIDSRMDRR